MLRGSLSPPAKPPPKAPARNAFAPTGIDPITGLRNLAPGGFDAKLPTGQARRAAVKLKAQQDLIKRHNDALIAARQAAATQRTILAKEAAKAGLPADIKHPFAGEGQPATPKGARDRYQPDLTAKSQLAAANALRRGQGGLLTKAQIAAEEAAQQTLAHSRAPTFADRYAGVLGDLAIIGGRPSGRPAPQPTEPAAKPAHDEGFVGGLLGTLGSPRFPKWISRNLNVVNIASDIGRQTERLRQGAGDIPHKAIAVSGFNDQVQAAILKANGGKMPKQVYLDDVLKRFGEGALGAPTRAGFVDMAKKNGWPVQDVKSWTDAELVARAFNKMDYSVFGAIRNAAADTGSLASLVTFPVQAGEAIGQSIATGSLTPIARTGGQLVDQWSKHLIGFGDRPFYQNLYEQPFTTVTSNAPFLKAGGTALGRSLRLSPTREITLPTTGEQLTVPTTRNVLTRPLTKLSDRLLAQSTHPDARIRPDSATTGVAAVKADIAAGARHPAQAVGHRIERGHARRVGERARLESVLGTGHEARQAINEYFNAIRQLPGNVRQNLPGRGAKVNARKQSGKQTRAEAIIYHHAVGTSSHELAPYYDQLAARTEAEATHLDAVAKQQHADAQAHRASGDAEAAKASEHQASLTEGQAAMARESAAAQRTHADYSRSHPVDVHNATPAEMRVVEAARRVSEVATKLKREGGQIGDTGALFGDLQHRLRIVRDTKAPGHELAAEILAHHAEMHGIESDILAQGKASTPKSPAANRALGAVRALRPLVKDVGERRAKVEAKRTARLARLEKAVGTATPTARRVGVKGSNAERIAGMAEAAAAKAGASKGVVRKIIQSSEAALNAKREAHANERIRPAEKAVAVMERSERAAHEKVAGAALKQAQAALRAGLLRRRAPEVLAKLENDVALAQGALDKGFMESPQLTAARATADRLAADNASVSLSKAEIDAITARHLKPAQRAAVDQVVLHDAVNEALYHGADRELARLHGRTKTQHDEAQARYEALAGSAADLAVKRDELAAGLGPKLEAFRTQQADEGRNPFHISLRAPGQHGPDRVRPASGTQFENGWYTRDVHIAVAADLETAARTAAETELFRRISETPYVIDSPPPGSAMPPGFALVKRDVLDALVRPHYTAAENLDLLNEWIQRSDRRAPGERVPEGGGPHVLISKDMLQWMKEELSYRHDNTGPAMQSALDFTNAYRRWMLFTLPRTLVNNAVGNPILAMMGGAGVMDYLRAVHLLARHPERVPITMRHRGPLANVLETQKITGWQSWFRHANVFHEDLGRLTVYMHHVVRYARQDQGLKFYQHVDMASSKMTALLDDLAHGRNPKIHEFNKFADQWFGNMAKRGRWDKALSLGVLFHRWVGHMIRLTLVTMPTKYPGRTALMLNLAHMADDYRKEHGLFPDWARGIIGLHTFMEKVGGGLQGVQVGLGTTGFFPLSTPAQTFDLGGVANPKSPLLTAMAANVNPGIRILLEQMLGARLDTLRPFTTPSGAPAGQFNPSVLWNQIGAATPLLNSVFTRTGQADTYRQVLDDLLRTDTRRYSSAGIGDPAYRSPSLSAGSGWGMLSRLGAGFGLPIRLTDVGRGPRTELAADKNLMFQYQTWLKNTRKQAAYDALTKKGASNYESSLTK